MKHSPNRTDASAFVVRHRSKILACLTFLGKVVEHVAPEKIARIRSPKMGQGTRLTEARVEARGGDWDYDNSYPEGWSEGYSSAYDGFTK